MRDFPTPKFPWVLACRCGYKELPGLFGQRVDLCNPQILRRLCFSCLKDGENMGIPWSKG